MTEQEYLQESVQLKDLQARHSTYKELNDRIKYDKLLLEQLENTVDVYSIDIKWSFNTSTAIYIPFEQIKDILINHVKTDLQNTIDELAQL